MVRLREIPRTSTFAWSPGAGAPFLATGTRAGAVDADFSNETCLELWALDLDRESAGSDSGPAAKISTDSGFNDIAWAESEDYPRGVIAGALENGSIDIWDADKLFSGASDPLITRASHHSSSVKTLQFNPKHSNLLASGGTKGELFVFDLNNIDQPFRLGNAAARVDDIECLDWNKKVPHILVTGSSAGFVTVWDVKTKKESLTLNNYGRKAVSAVAWDPEKPTKLITSIPLETDPLILVWDLRNSNAPERILKGHESGILSLSWCPQDPDLLLSSGKDNRTICWNPQTGQALGEFPIVTNWTFQTRWNPHNPNLFATASFDGKIAVQTIQNTGKESAASTQPQPVNDEDFFAKAQTQAQAPKFSLPKAPKWLERPAAASFGFGGRLVSVGLTEPDNPECRSSKITISHFEVDANIANATESFEAALKSGDLRSICESRVSSAQSEEDKADWRVMETLISDSPRKELVDYLGFSANVDEAADSLSKLGLGNKEANGTPATDSLKPPAATRKHKRLTSIFDASGDSDPFLEDLTASKGAKTNQPFQIYTGLESEADRSITRALLLGQFEKALDTCLQEERMSDAFMIAICGGQKCIDKAQEAYFLKKAEGPSYIRLMASVAGKNLWDVVHNADLANWKEAMASICTFADDQEFPDLCDALGDRLDENARSQGLREGRKDASFCYLASSKLEKVVSIWIAELQESEKDRIQSETDDTSFSIHARGLQDLVEKVTVFRQVTRFEDPDLRKASDWKLSQLYDKYVEYANVIATHGRLDVAARYLDLLPGTHEEAQIARNRIKQATKKAESPAALSHTAASRQPSKPLPRQPAPYQPAQPAFSPPAPAPAAPPNPYAAAAAAPAPPPNPYAPAASSTGYGPPAGYQAPQPRPADVGPPPQQFGAGMPPPPRASTQSPSASGAAYTHPTNVPAWNDLPEGFARSSTPRRGTPNQGGSVISAPFPNQPSTGTQGPPAASPPPTVPGQKRTQAAVPPPPKGPAAPQRVASPPGPGMPHGANAPERPPSTSNVYAPPAPPAPPQGPQGPQVAQTMNAPPVPRGPSPYNAPPAAPPPTNRYAPNPASQPSPPQAQQHPHVAAPPQAGPGPTQYAPQQMQQMQQPSAPGPYGPPPQAAQPPQQPPPVPGADSRPSTSQSQKKPAPAPKHPPGDRSHIPANAQPVFEILAADMQRVKSRAPASFKAQVNDTERRLGILFDHLNNEDLLKPNTIETMTELARALQSKDYDTAHTIHLDILTNKTDECGNWMVGVKRLIGMSRATP